MKFILILIFCFLRILCSGREPNKNIILVYKLDSTSTKSRRVADTFYIKRKYISEYEMVDFYYFPDVDTGAYSSDTLRTNNEKWYKKVDGKYILFFSKEQFMNNQIIKIDYFDTSHD